MSKKIKAFTLVELAVVLLIIGILAGVILRNIGSQPIQARDTKRLAVLRNFAIYLTQYFSKQGHYPVGSYTQDTQSQKTLIDELIRVGVLPPGTSEIGFPKPTNFKYVACTDNPAEYPVNAQPNHFVIQVTMEQSPNQAPELYRDSQKVPTGPSGWTCDTTPPDCDIDLKHFCLVQ
jgi:prepilin-type N-terminal cleavage/methylation domain-containing protein